MASTTTTLLAFLIAIQTTITTVRSANILGVALHPSFSHQIVFRPIWKHLSLRGHNVTVLTTDPMRNPELTNLTEIDLSFAYKIWKSSGIIEVSRKEGFHKFFFKSIDVGEKIMRAELEVKEVRELLEDNNTKFDLVIVEPVYTLGLGFAQKFNCPLALIYSTDAFGNLQGMFGNPNHPLLYPTYILPIDNPMTLLERLQAFLYPFFERYALTHVYSRNNVLLKEYFGENTSVEELFDKANLLLTSVNPAFGIIRPTQPTVVPLGGGFHLEEPKSPPAELKEFLDNATEGVVYFSLGSNVFSANIEDDKRKLLLEVFSQLPYKVIWKFENETMDGKPDNVHLFKWVPQWDVLNHPNIKVFITQGGLQSLEEALYANVPVVVMPQVADQFFNMKRAVNKGIGLGVDLNRATKSELSRAILEIAQNPRYRLRMKELVDFADDQPQKNIDRVIWWLEYALRHNGTGNFEAVNVRTPFCNYCDVPAIVAVLILLSIAILSVTKLYLFLSSHSIFVKIKSI